MRLYTHKFRNLDEAKRILESAGFQLGERSFGYAPVYPTTIPEGYPMHFGTETPISCAVLLFQYGTVLKLFEDEDLILKKYQNVLKSAIETNSRARRAA